MSAREWHQANTGDAWLGAFPLVTDAVDKVVDDLGEALCLNKG